jgi:hypothetical protein
VASANAGQFFTPLGGIRKTLRRNAHRSQYLLYHIESALMEWLHAIDVTLNPEDEEAEEAQLLGDQLEGQPLPSGRALWDGSPVVEVARSRKRLIWQIAEDGFARYVVHCSCRFHSVVSYSKSDN